MGKFPRGVMAGGGGRESRGCLRLAGIRVAQFGAQRFEFRLDLY